MIDNLYEHFQHYIQKHGLLSGVTTLLVGCSGGPDSTALLHLLVKIAGHKSLRLLVAHINYKLRGEESDRDEEHVRQLASDLNLPIYVKNAEVDLRTPSKSSVQMRCRGIRFQYFENVMHQTGSQRVALGHTLDDNIETFFIRLFSGSGLEGLKGMTPIFNKCYIRPLLSISRKDIEHYLHSQSITYTVDSSNIEKKYLRNRIRHQLLPYIRRNFESSIERIMHQTLNILQVENEYIENEIAKIFNDPLICSRNPSSIRFNRSIVQKLDDAIQRRLFIKASHELNKSGRAFSNLFEKIELLMAALKNNKNIVRIEYKKNLFVEEADGYLVFFIEDQHRKDQVTIWHYSLPIPGQVAIKEIGLEFTATIFQNKLSESMKREIFNDPNREIFDLQALPTSLQIRTRRSGDSFKPIGSKGTTTLKKFFINAKIPQQKRDAIPIVEADSNVIWVAGYRRSDLALLTDVTSAYVLLTVDKRK